MSLKRATLAGLAGALVSTTALAGGFDRGGVQIDQLFDAGTTMGARAAYVMPQRELKNYQRAGNAAAPARDNLIAGGQELTAQDLFGTSFANLAGIIDPTTNLPVQTLITLGVTQAVDASLVPASSASVNVEGDYSNFSLGFKAGFGSGVDCLAHYSQPYGAYANYGQGNAQSRSAVEFQADADDYGLTCSYQFSVAETSLGQAYARVIGGVSYQEFEGFQSRQSFADFAIAGLDAIPNPNFDANDPTQGPAAFITNTNGLGLFNVEGDDVGYRIGAAFEIPKSAIRATILYSSKYDFSLTGTQNNTGFGAQVPGLGVVPISASFEIPQALDIRLQSGINDRTLAFVNMRWQDWSQLQSIRIVGGRSPVPDSNAAPGTDPFASNLAFEPFYRDGYTISAGVGRVLTDELSGLAAVGWDRGTSTTSGSQTDTWTLSGGLSYKPVENVEINFGGLVGLLTSGSSGPNPAQIDNSNNVTYSFGDDVVYALSAGFKAKF